MFNLNGWLTCMGSILIKTTENVTGWDKVGTVANIVMAVATIGALVIAISAWKNSKRAEWREVIGRYFREYRGERMGRAVSELHRFYRDNGNNPVQVIRNYIDHALASDDFHFTRRRVSAFYQELGALVSTSSNMREIVYSLWRKGDFDIIVKILLPIEAIANKWAIEGRDTWVTLAEEQKEEKIREDVRQNMRKVWPVKDGEIVQRGGPVDVIVRNSCWEVVKLNMYDLWDKASPKTKDYFRDVTEHDPEGHGVAG